MPSEQKEIYNAEVIVWENVPNITSKSYKCSFCGNQIASNTGWRGFNSLGNAEIASIYICHNCKRPTFFYHEKQYPNELIGSVVNNINNPIVEQLYNEARNCAATNCFTASVLCCRKLLMHIAVAKGAKEKDSFINYVEYLKAKNFVPPDAKWVDHIRSKGNEANHEIVIMNEGDAKELILFIEMLLKIIYEFPAMIENKQK